MAKVSALEKFAYKQKEKKPTGIDCLDTLLKNGPEEGDLICLASKQGGGKSTMLLQLSRIYIEEYGMKVAYLDVERGVKQEILENMGLDQYIPTGQFFLTNQVSTYTDAQEVIDEILASNDKWGMLVIDSITQLVPTKMIEVEVESQQMALKARAMTAFLDKYRGALANKNIITFAIAQYRKNMNQTYYGASEYNTAAPMALNHAADVIMHITTSQAKDRKIFATANTSNGIQDIAVGATHYLWAEKNKHAIPGIKVNFPVVYGQEISNLEYLKRLIEDKKLYEKSNNSWYSSIAGIECKVNGKPGFAKFVEDNFESIREKLFLEGHYDLVSLQGVINVEDKNGIAIGEINED
jgi:RecA/RadA recombinase